RNIRCREHLSMLDSKPCVLQSTDSASRTSFRCLFQSLLISIQNLMICRVANCVSSNLKTSLETAPSQVVDLRFGGRNIPFVSGASEYGSLNAAPRDPSAPSAKTLMLRTVNSCCGSISGPRLNHSSVKPELEPSSIA